MTDGKGVRGDDDLHITLSIVPAFVKVRSQVDKYKIKSLTNRNFSPLSRLARLSLHTSQVARQAGAYPGFHSMKRLGVFLLPPGWDASPSQGYPPALSSPVPI